MHALKTELLSHPAIDKDVLAQRLVDILCRPTAMSSAGYPYLEREAFECFRDTVPHILGMGGRVWNAIERVVACVQDLGYGEHEDFVRATQVVRTILNTAAVTAPPDLWLVHHVVAALEQLGLAGRLVAGEAIDPQRCDGALAGGKRRQLDAHELQIDFNFLLSRGYLVQEGSVYRLASNRQARGVFTELRRLPDGLPESVAKAWGAVFSGESIVEAQVALLAHLTALAQSRDDLEQHRWYATADEVTLGYLAMPMLLGLWQARQTDGLVQGSALTATQFDTPHRELVESALLCFVKAGWLESLDFGATAGRKAREAAAPAYRATPLGKRVCERGPGPFGIIEAYHTYMARLPEILLNGRRGVHVSRGPNVAASQTANRAAFTKANDLLDGFCATYGFRYEVFIEHAVGMGEGIRQRAERSGHTALRYVGADLEEAALEAARSAQARGKLPANTQFITADIGQPEELLTGLKRLGIAAENAVMVVGNGFHEVRHQTDEKMIAIFQAYQQAGIVVLFTEETALSVDELLTTGWNTYHAGFRYVHEKSGQGLRPAFHSPVPQVGPPLPLSWDECATRAGYVRATQFCSRTRTIFPYPPTNGHNPPISVTFFFVPSRIAHKVGLEAAE